MLHSATDAAAKAETTEDLARDATRLFLATESPTQFNDPKRLKKGAKPHLSFFFSYCHIAQIPLYHLPNLYPLDVPISSHSSHSIQQGTRDPCLSIEASDIGLTTRLE